MSTASIINASVCRRMISDGISTANNSLITQAEAITIAQANDAYLLHKTVEGKYVFSREPFDVKAFPAPRYVVLVGPE